MTREELIEVCRKAPTFAKGAIKHEDFLDYIVVLTRTNRETGVITETPYMPVPGKLAMAVADHNAQGKKFSVAPAEVLISSDKHVVLRVNCDSEIYGIRSGIAMSRFGARGAEGDNPYEVGETSALGRALAGYGYGLLPKSGLSAGDINSASTVGTSGARRPAPAQGAASSAPVAPKTLSTFWMACMKSYGKHPREVLQLLGVATEKPEELEAWVKEQGTNYPDLFVKVGTLVKANEEPR